jgi:acetyltransferase-like isoleucine patch superfamily enzyme
MRGISYLYPYKLSRRFNAEKTFLYTQWIKRFIGHLGENTSIGYPCTLQGNLKSISIGPGTRIQPHSVIECWSKFGADEFNPSITIGNDCNIGEFCHLSAINRITIGDGLLTGRFVYIGDNSHGGLSKEESEIRPELRRLQSKGEVMIGKNVWIGDKVTILGGVTIGDGAIIGANTVVTHDVPPNSVSVGGGQIISCQKIVGRTDKSLFALWLLRINGYSNEKGGEYDRAVAWENRRNIVLCCNARNS